MTSPDNNSPAAPTCEQGRALEHGVLLRHVAKLQDRVTRLLGLKEAELQGLQADIFRLRSQLLVARTAALWGLRESLFAPPHPHQPEQKRASLERSEELSLAHRAICQTGCTGHAHYWLTADGQCRRTGLNCDQQSLESSVPGWPKTNNH